MSKGHPHRVLSVPREQAAVAVRSPDRAIDLAVLSVWPRCISKRISTKEDPG